MQRAFPVAVDEKQSRHPVATLTCSFPTIAPPHPPAAQNTERMYHIDSGINPGTHAGNLNKDSRAKVGGAVYFLGLTSLLTDISAEMVASVLPIYLLMVLRLSPFEYGLIDGLYNGTTAIVRLASGYLSDRSRRHKAVAFLGYLLSAISKCGLLVAGFAGWASVAAVLLVDRIGKGIRTAPRDAMIAANAAPQALGAAFGVHRALDAVGAIIGPLLATAILLWLPGRFDYVFMVSICFAVFGLLILGSCVKIPRASAPPVALTVSATLAALKTRRFMLLTASATLLSLFTLTDNMIYVGLQRRLDFEPTYLPLLFVATASVFMCLAIPAGRLADRIGHLRVFIMGYLLLAAVYCLFAVLPSLGRIDLVLYVVLLGTYYAATDGVIVALAARHLRPDIRTTGIACLTTLVSIGRMGSSILFGWLWHNGTQEQAVGMFGIAMLAALALTIVLARQLSKAAPASTFTHLP